MAQHALFTGTGITGRIPHGDGYVNVTPDVLYFDTPEEAESVAESIEVEHAVRGTHPLDDECKHLDDPGRYPHGIPDDVRKAHQSAHKSLKKKAGL